MHHCYSEFTAKQLYNQLDKSELEQRLESEPYPRITVSFYCYAHLDNPERYRHETYLKWSELGVLGRIYVAKEGINAQVSVPRPNYAAFQHLVREDFPKIPFKEAVAEEGISFLKLSFKVRKKILVDGQDDGSYDVTNVGNHLTAAQWNDAMNSNDSVVVDVRNHYEHEVGYFENALKPDVDSFKEELPVIKDMLAGQEDKKILLYCTGGIRCEKTSAWLRAQGFEDVNQLHGGIIDYAKQVKEQKLDNKFLGKNFVFDGRLGERITDDVLSNCHQCGDASDDHTNCAWDGCHILFIQCKACADSMQGCCSPECQDFLNLPDADQQVVLKSAPKNPPGFYNKSRCQRDGKVRGRAQEGQL